MGIDEAVQHIRGQEGTDVTLKIYREGELEMLEKTVTRAKIDIPTVDTKKDGNVFVISLYSFNAISEAKMREALQEYAQSGARKLIVDLRGNPGGFLQSAVSIASYFVPAGKTIVRENFGDGLEEELYRSQGRTLGDFAPDEMLVLVDGGSASASEILAGALQEHGIAKLLGEQTFGKGSVQELVSLRNGSSLKVTVARWFTPNGISISEGGLTPDIVVERTPQQVIEGVDPQLEAAIKWLNGDKTVGSSTARALGL
jgi:carboxyl-terminal processing protease